MLPFVTWIKRQDALPAFNGCRQVAFREDALCDLVIVSGEPLEPRQVDRVRLQQPFGLSQLCGGLFETRSLKVHKGAIKQLRRKHRRFRLRWIALQRRQHVKSLTSTLIIPLRYVYQAVKKG